ncbi:F420-dependent oxidoreductase-like protein [Thermosporothrix hazakensis]|uniref:F420-dependent oxidoreductase-like protein n=2 Tax=Thermosporothrix TaxID=768650 RepID=A0A326U5B9_THEHA|nr:LLM class F420-dependent oxidoreductase [Thermosporothrix hazakensis]PZW26698.1 F420-dependent oxidoreductase-like protein [Thermosporothrix hazakensis]BBH89418.1 LLM class F420-dependent oxidoreductase [Thermosporothrix sp. COM3]GCE47601.1 LLM class F420-dependent oxidoreductase [Thermosporothrix hazakensis]
MKFGVIVPQGWRLDLVDIADPVEAYEAMTRVAQRADALNFNSIWLYDHFHTVPRPEQEITFECWSSIAALARDTKKVKLGQIVTCNSYRNPALLAKMASTVDVLSHGRLYFGIGAGWYEHEYRAYGYDYPETKERLGRLREAVQVILAMWTQEEATFEGKYYQIRGAINQPKGVQKPHIPLLIGGGGEKVTLRLVAKYADACNLGGDIANITHKLDVLRQHCEAIGRDYNEIWKTAIVDHCAIAETEEAAIAKLKPEEQQRVDTMRKAALIGTPEMIRARLQEYEAAGIQELIIRFVDSATNPDVLDLFARECMQA